VLENALHVTTAPTMGVFVPRARTCALNGTGKLVRMVVLCGSPSNGSILFGAAGPGTGVVFVHKKLTLALGALGVVAITLYEPATVLAIKPVVATPLLFVGMTSVLLPLPKNTPPAPLEGAVNETNVFVSGRPVPAMVTRTLSGTVKAAPRTEV
jgi:hypothetical protein